MMSLTLRRTFKLVSFGDVQYIGAERLPICLHVFCCIRSSLGDVLISKASDSKTPTKKKDAKDPNKRSKSASVLTLDVRMEVSRGKAIVLYAQTYTNMCYVYMRQDGMVQVQNVHVYSLRIHIPRMHRQRHGHPVFMINLDQKFRVSRRTSSTARKRSSQKMSCSAVIQSQVVNLSEMNWRCYHGRKKYGYQRTTDLVMFGFSKNPVILGSILSCLS